MLVNHRFFLNEKEKTRPLAARGRVFLAAKGIFLCTAKSSAFSLKHFLFTFSAISLKCRLGDSSTESINHELGNSAAHSVKYRLCDSSTSSIKHKLSCQHFAFLGELLVFIRTHLHHKQIFVYLIVCTKLYFHSVFHLTMLLLNRQSGFHLLDYVKK